MYVLADGRPRGAYSEVPQLPEKISAAVSETPLVVAPNYPIAPGPVEKAPNRKSAFVAPALHIALTAVRPLCHILSLVLRFLGHFSKINNQESRSALDASGLLHNRTQS